MLLPPFLMIQVFIDDKTWIGSRRTFGIFVKSQEEQLVNSGQAYAEEPTIERVAVFGLSDNT